MTTRTGRWMGPAELYLRTRRARRHGDAADVLRATVRAGRAAVGVRLRGRRVLLLLDPGLAAELLSGHEASTVKGPSLRRARGLLGDGLLTSEGAAHDRARRLLAPAFSPRRLDGYVEIFARCARDATADWTDGERRDVHVDMAALTLRAAGHALLGADVSALAPSVRAGLDAALAEFGVAGRSIPVGLGRGGDSAARGTRGASDRAHGRSVRDTVHRLVDEIIDQRRAAPPGERGDVISALLAASEGPDVLTPREVHDHVMTLLLAGHETTASALTWTLYLLGRHPWAQQQVQAEADCLGGRAVSAGDLPDLVYTRAVISEAIRLYPPAWIIGRMVTTELDLGGWRLPPGSIAAVSPLLLHRDPRWYPEPERFDPRRWLGGHRVLPRHAYLPFGTGPRACIGEQFAWTEAVTMLATLAQSWTFRADPSLAPAISYRITLRPSGSALVTVHTRRRG